MTSAPTTAKIIAPPPLLFMGTVLIGIALDRIVPLELLTALPSVVRYGVGGVLVLVALALAQPGKAAFDRASTPVKPWQPTTALVTEGVYARLRNPMYVALVLLQLGGGVALAGDWMALMALPLALLLHHGVVLHEEQYLEGLFGDDYRRYCERVPRYGW